jgi:hypothetical protein
MREGGPAFSVDTADVSTWCDVGKGKRYIAGKPDATWSGGGVWEADSTTPGTTDKVDELLAAALGAAAAAVHLPQGESLGAPAFIIDGIENTYEITSPGDDVTAFSLELQSSAGNATGRTLRPSTGALGISATGNGSNVDDQALMGIAAPTATLLGAVAALQVLQKGGGAGMITVSIESSVNGSTGWAAIATFTGATAAHFAQVLEVAKGVTINRYLRAAWVVTGGTWDIHVSLARKMV